jgi:hypothetical protein
MNELNLRRICANLEIGEQKQKFFNNTYKNKIVLGTFINQTVRQPKFKI